MSAAFDAIAIGQHFDFGVYEFTAERIKDYACRFDPQLFHLDEAAAEKSAFGGLCASGWHTASALMRLQVDYFAALANQGETLPRFGMSPGFDNLKWLKPVYAGDRVAYTGTVAAKRLSRSRPGQAIVSIDFTGENQRGEPVFAMTGHVLVAV